MFLRSIKLIIIILFLNVGGGDISISRKSSYCGVSPYNNRRRDKKISPAKQKERHDWLKKYAPLSSAEHNNGRDSSAASATPQSYHTSHNDVATDTMDTSAYLDANAYFDPNSDQAYLWLIIVSLVIVYYLWTMIVRMARFNDGATSDHHRNPLLMLLLIAIDVICNAVFGIDMYIQSHTGYLRNGILETKAERTSRRYKLAWKYYFDMVSIIPFDILLDLGIHSQPILLWIKLFKVYRLLEFYNITENRTHFPNACRVVFLFHNILLIIHWNACIYYSISKKIGFGTDQWVYPITNATTTSNDYPIGAAHSYIHCFYWSTLTLTTIGGHPEPVTVVERMFMTVDYLVGILMFATLVGNIGGIIANMRKSKAKFQGKLDRVKGYMKAMDVPGNLQERVIKWFDYLWTHGHPVDNNTALNSLPDKLKAEIAIHVHFETLKKVDFFDHCDQSFLWELVLRLQIQVYSPGDYVCRKGDVGREMYIVSHGKLEVVAEEDGDVLRVLNHGDYFGEISVLNLGSSHRRRTAFVRSVGYSDLLCLSQNDLFDVLYDYPQAMEVLQSKGKEKLGNRNESDEELSDIASSFFETTDGSADIQDTLSDCLEELPVTQADIQQMTNQLLDLQIKMYEIEDSVRELINEIRKGTPERNNDNYPIRRHSSKDRVSVITNQQPQVILTPPAENNLQFRRSSVT